MSKVVKNLYVLATFFILIGFLAGQEQEKSKYAFPDYKTMRARVVELYNQKNFREAVNVLSWAWDRFPDQLLSNAYNLAAMHGELKEYDKGVQALNAALDRGVFFGLWQFFADFWATYKEQPEFQAFLERNKGIVAEAQKKAVLKVEVDVPEGYDKTKAYPLFIALHGGGENIAEFKPLWTSPVLKKDFLVAYVQSTQVATMTGFHWQDAALTGRDLTEAFARVKAEYPVDLKNVFIGGFSSGGYGSLVALLNDVLPARGFIILCPPVPEAEFESKVPGLKARGVRGTFLTTERDNRLAEQKRWQEIFTKAGLDVEFAVAPATGHWYPDDFAARVDAALRRMSK
jgi:predicted esterase